MKISFIKAFTLALTVTLLLTFMLVSVGAEKSSVDGVKAPGGNVTTPAEFITALGGEKNAEITNGTIRIINNIILTAPIYVNSGSYRIIGGGCSIYRGFDDGALIQLTATALTDKEGNPASLPSLTIGADINIDDQRLDDPDLILDGNSENFTSSINGPLIAILGKGTVIINPSTKLTNNHSAVPGGAIYIESFGLGDESTPLEPTLIVKGGEISGNSSEVEGGAIAAYGMIKSSPSGSISITGCKIEGNTTVSPDESTLSRGGAIFSDGVAITLNDCDIVSNSADNGGALHVNHDIEIINCNVSKNLANAGGGAIYVDLPVNEYGQSPPPAKVSLKNNYVTENHSGGIGGAIVNKATLTLVADNSSYISSNTSTGNGAVIYNEGTLELNSGQIYHNSSSGGRGGIYNSGLISFNDADVRMNTATVGGAIYNLGTLNYYGGCLTGNKCTVKNAPQVANLGKMSMRGSFIIEDDVVGLFHVTDSNGNSGYTVIEVEDKITTNVKINVAFYQTIDENTDPSEMKYANKSGYHVFSGLKRHISVAAPRTQIVHSGFGGYEIDSTGTLKFAFPIMPLGAWIGCILGATALSVGAVLFIKKKKASDGGNASDEKETEKE